LRPSRGPGRISTHRPPGSRRHSGPNGRSHASFSAAADGPRDLSLRVALRDGLSLVELPLAAGEADLHLGMVAREVDAQRDKCVSLLLDLADQARDLLAVEQELARPHRIVVHDVALCIRRDVDVLQPCLAVVDPDKAVAEVGASVSYRLHLGSRQHHARLVLLVDEVVVVCAAVDRDIPLFIVLLRHRPAPASPAPASCPAAGPLRTHTGRPRRGPSRLSPDRAWWIASRLAMAAAPARACRSRGLPSPTRADPLPCSTSAP